MPYSSCPGDHTLSLPEVNVLIVEIPTPKPCIFMIRMTMQLKCLIAQAPGVIPIPYRLWTVLYSVSSEQNGMWATQAQLSAEPLVFMSSGLKGHVIYCHHFASVVVDIHLHVHISNFFSEITGPIKTKLGKLVTFGNST